MNRRTIAPTVAGLATILALVVACTSAGVPASSRATQASISQKPAATPGSSDESPISEMADLLVLRMAAATPNAAYTVIEAAGRRILFDLPDGVVSRDWRTLVALTSDGSSTRVDVTEPEGGTLPIRVPIPGAWRLPTIGIAKVAGGLSADGSTLVLEEALPAAPISSTSRTRFALVASSGRTAPRVVTLDGSFTYDALSPDGRWLYLLELSNRTDPSRYHVRRLDVASGRLEDGTIVDKRNVAEQMNGYAVTQEVGRGGWVYTLYSGDDGFFVHALDTADGIAFCIDLPGTAGEDATTAAAWGLVADPSANWLYVADPARKTVSAIDVAAFTISRSAKLAVAPTIVLAKLDSALPVGGRAALSQDGDTLYVIDATGVAVVRVADLATTGHLGGNGVFRSIAVGSKGAVYAVDSAGRAVRLGPDGASQIANGTYTSIVAIAPLR